MLEKLPAALADSQPETYTFGIAVFSITAGTISIVSRNGFNGLLGARKALGHVTPFCDFFVDMPDCFGNIFINRAKLFMFTS